MRCHRRQTNQMKKAISIFLLGVFFLFQSGRILLYFECKFSNSITTSSCDCVQILTDIKPGSPADVMPPDNHTNHRHLPEEFEQGAAIRFASAAIPASRVYADYIPLHSTAWRGEIFHPPLA